MHACALCTMHHAYTPQKLDGAHKKHTSAQAVRTRARTPCNCLHQGNATEKQQVVQLAQLATHMHHTPHKQRPRRQQLHAAALRTVYTYTQDQDQDQGRKDPKVVRSGSCTTVTNTRPHHINGTVVHLVTNHG